MKTSFKYAIACVAAMTATSAFADVTLPNTGNGELMLFARNTVTNQTYVRGLGLTEDSFLTRTSIIADGSYVVGEERLTSGLPTIAADANLTSFLNSASASSQAVQWTIMGGGYLLPASDVSLGNQRFITANQAAPGSISNAPITNTQLSFFRNINATATNVNSAIPGAAPGDMGSALGTSQWWAPTLSPNPVAWYGIAGMNNANPLDTSANLYMVASSGGSNPARVYTLNDVTLAANGTLSFAPGAPEVPLPAAVWLLGSGLLGLLGVGRRRSVLAA